VFAVILVVVLAVSAAVVLNVYFRLYRWARRALGEPEPESVPYARVMEGAEHPGFLREPTWLRPLQASIMAFGLLVLIVSSIGVAVLALVGAYSH
jgi:hypothetical protein